MHHPENPRNQDAIGAKELLVISFGTSFPESRRKTIGAIEDTLEAAFPDYDLRRAFTSSKILRILKKRDGIEIDDIRAALERAKRSGVQELIIQPTHMMNGFEYEKLMEIVAEYRSSFPVLKVGTPLLTDDADYSRLIQAITDATKEYCDGKTAVCFMGHGTEAQSNLVYHKLQARLAEQDFSNYYIATVEADPTVQDILRALPAGIQRVVLEPLMVVAGDHANNDMAGDEDDSWKSIFQAAGYETVCLLRGLGELEAVRQIYIDHVRSAK